MAIKRSNWVFEQPDEPRTQFTVNYYEVTKLKSAFNWWIACKLLEESAKIDLYLVEPEETDTNCYLPAEVAAMIACCRANPKLAWLADVILALSRTGMRISELADLRWSNLNFDLWVITLRDKSRSRRKKSRGHRRPKEAVAEHFQFTMI